MMDLTARWVVPWLTLLAEWSVRWGVVIAMLAAWLALRPPRRTATRHLLCLAALAAGVLLPVAPGGATRSSPGRAGGAGGRWVAAIMSAATVQAGGSAAELAHSPAEVEPISPPQGCEEISQPGRYGWRPVPIPSDRRRPDRASGVWRRWRRPSRGRRSYWRCYPDWRWAG